MADGSERQDRIRIVDVDGVLIAAVADGVGTASRGADGAAAAVDGATEFLITLIGSSASRRSIFGEAGQGDLRVEPAGDPLTELGLHWPTVLVAALTNGRQRALETAKALSVEPREAATTLMVCAVVDQVLHVAQIGDGYVVTWDEEEQRVIGILAGREESEQDPSLVVPVTAPQALRRLVTTSVAFPPQHSALLTTDGIAPILLDRWVPPQPSMRFLHALSTRLRDGSLNSESLGEFLVSPLVESRIDDDKSVVLITWGEPEPAAAGASMAAHVESIPDDSDTQPVDVPGALQTAGDDPDPLGWSEVSAVLSDPKPEPVTGPAAEVPLKLDPARDLLPDNGPDRASSGSGPALRLGDTEPTHKPPVTTHASQSSWRSTADALPEGDAGRDVVSPHFDVVATPDSASGQRPPADATDRRSRSHPEQPPEVRGKASRRWWDGLLPWG